MVEFKFLVLLEKIMKSNVIIVGCFLFIVGCNNMSQRPSSGSFKLFGTLRSPKNLYESPPTPLPTMTPAPTSLGPVPSDSIPQYYPGTNPPVPNPSPALNPGPGLAITPNESISQKIKTYQTPETVKLLPPESATNHSTLKPMEEKPAESKEPPLAKTENQLNNSKNKKQPIDIPGFSWINNSIGIGLLPYPDGIEWLVNEKFKSALFIHTPTQETKAITSLFQKRGLQLNLLQLEESNISAERLNIEISKLQNASSQPIYIFDLDGSIAASFWYAYFQKVMPKTEEETLSQLQKLGMNPNKTEQSRQTFKALKKVAW